MTTEAKANQAMLHSVAEVMRTIDARQELLAAQDAEFLANEARLERQRQEVQQLMEYNEALKAEIAANTERLAESQERRTPEELAMRERIQALTRDFDDASQLLWQQHQREFRADEEARRRQRQERSEAWAASRGRG